MTRKSVLVFSQDADFAELMRIRLGQDVAVRISSSSKFRLEFSRCKNLCCVITDESSLSILEFMDLRELALKELQVPLFVFTTKSLDMDCGPYSGQLQFFPMYGNNGILREKILSLPHLQCSEVEPPYYAEQDLFSEELCEIVGESDAILNVKRVLQKAGSSSLSILFLGRSGTGKTFLAEMTHKISGRKGRFFPVNIASIPKELMASSLFGSVRGAFTDALEREGYFSSAEGGTLFLDEIGDMPMELQTMLLHVIEMQQFSKVGSTELQKCDVRLLFATNRDLKQMVGEGTFREDLYYRINGFTITVPSLCERTDDIHALAQKFLRCGQKEFRLSPEASAMLTDYSWPGNIRQLRACIERACVLASGDVIRAKDIIFD